MSAPPLITPDGRYIVVRGRLWRRSNPALDPDERRRLVDQLMAARRAVGQALRAGDADGRQMAMPAYDQAIKASHAFNLLDARGVISVTERQSYILRVRELAKACGQAWLKTEAGGAPAPS